MNTPVYWLTRMFVKPAIVLYFRLRRLGREHMPEGGVILASNHRSFLDPFAIGCCIGRPIYFVAKEELFKNPVIGWFLNCLGAFPVMRGEVRRGVGDHLAGPARWRAGRGHLSRGHANPVRLAGPAQAGRRAPCARERHAGGADRGHGLGACARRVEDQAGQGAHPLRRAAHLPARGESSHFLAGEVTERIWPCVCLQWEWLGGLPPLRTAAVVGAGCMGTAAATVLSRAGLDVQLGCRSAAQAERVASERENVAYLPGVILERGIEVKTVSEIELAGVDLVLLAVPCASLPAVMGELGTRVGDRSAVLVASEGLVPPLGTTPSAYVSERVRARAVATLAGPATPARRRAGRLGGGGHAGPGPSPPAARRA